MKPWPKLCRSFQYHHITLITVTVFRVFHPLFTCTENVSPSQGRWRRISFSFLTVAFLFFLLWVSPAENINISFHFYYQTEMFNKHSHQLMTHSNSHDRLVDSIGFLKQEWFLPLQLLHANFRSSHIHEWFKYFYPLRKLFSQMYELFAQCDSGIRLEEADYQFLTLKMVIALWPLIWIAKIEFPW